MTGGGLIAMGLALMAAGAMIPVLMLGGEMGMSAGAITLVAAGIILAWLVPIALALWVQEAAEIREPWEMQERNKWT